jgi:hypothetical protein
MARPVFEPFLGAGTVPFNLRQRSPVYPFTQQTAALLRDIYSSPGQVIIEWRAMLRDEVRVRRTGRHRRHCMYSPAIDLAVGPFATHRRLIRSYDQMVGQSANMIEAMIQYYRENLRRFESDFEAPSFEQLCTLNQNARCFLAIEIEMGNQNPKHLMGSTINASALSRIGIIVAWNRCRLNGLLRGREFLSYLRRLEKNSFNTTNLLFLTRDQFTTILERELMR